MNAKNIELKSKRVVLRPINESDAAALYAYRSDSITNQYQGWIPGSEDEALDFIRKIAKEFNMPGSWFQLAVIENASQKMIGDLGIHFIDEEGYQVEVGCTLHKDWHGKGYASEAMSTVIDCLFSHFKKHRIVASIDPRNKSSIALVERLGFRLEAHFRESIWLNNEWVDDMVYAMLKSDWKPSEN